jgi:hypothetical protein
MSFKHADWVRNNFDPRLFEAFNDIAQKTQAIAQQVNGSSTGLPTPPPAPNALTVNAQNGHFSVAIQDQNDIYRGIHYHVEYADNPHFTNPQPWHLGPNRNETRFLGNGTFHFRAASSYGISPPSAWVYHGSAAAPTPVSGGGLIGVPAFLPSQGTGTGQPGVGLSGPGLVPFRSSTGKAPIR